MRAPGGPAVTALPCAFTRFSNVAWSTARAGEPCSGCRAAVLLARTAGIPKVTRSLGALRSHARSRPAYSSRVRGGANRGPDSFRRRTAPPDHGSATALAEFETGRPGVEHRFVFRLHGAGTAAQPFSDLFPSSVWLRQAQWRELESLLDFAVLGRYNQQQPSADPLITSRNQRLRLYSTPLPPRRLP